jgi:8-oxo-dGTP pyrophosphatase MutT (NUDIX family)
MDDIGNKFFDFCPQCGKEQFLFRKLKYFQCSDCGFEFYFNMAAAVAAIIRNDRNEILFTIRSHEPAKGTLDLPGGFVDPGETAEQALAREIKEELNLEITGFRFVMSSPNVYPYGGFTYQTLDLVFECSVRDLNNIRPADDVSGYIFIDPSKIEIEKVGLQSVKRIISDYFTP